MELFAKIINGWKPVTTSRKYINLGMVLNLPPDKCYIVYPGTDRTQFFYLMMNLRMNFKNFVVFLRS